MKILFWHRKNKQNTRGEAPIYCRITINGVRGSDFTTNVFCRVNQFNAPKQSIIDDDMGNMKLSNIRYKINSIFLELDNKGDFITPNIIRDFLLGKRVMSLTFCQLMTEYKEHRFKQVKINEIKDSTWRKSCDTIKNMTLFLEHKQIKNTSIKMINARLINEFYYWLQEFKKTGPEYASKSIQIIKAILNYAILNDYINFNPLVSLRFKRGQRKRIEFLNPDELLELKKYKFSSQRLQQTADLFLIQCYTGFSYADLADFRPSEHIEKDSKGREWIMKPRAKNGLESVLPYFPEAKMLVQKYTRADLVLELPVLSNQKYNSYLKEIGSILGIKTKLTTHIGRKTFGTIALNDGYSIESVSKMLGHTNIKTTQGHYAVVLKKRIVGEN